MTASTSLTVWCLCVIRFVSGEEDHPESEVFPLKDGQRYASRIHVYRVLRNHKTTPHGIYVVDGNKLKKDEAHDVRRV